MDWSVTWSMDQVDRVGYMGCGPCFSYMSVCINNHIIVGGGGDRGV